MDTLGYFTQELDYNLLKNLKLDMGGVNLVVHAIVVVTIGVVTSRTVVVSYLLSYCCLLLLLENKNELQTCFQMYYIIAIENLLYAKSKSRASSTLKACM